MVLRRHGRIKMRFTFYFFGFATHGSKNTTFNQLVVLTPIQPDKCVLLFILVDTLTEPTQPV